MKGYLGYFVSAISPLVEPFMRGHAPIPIIQGQPSLLETTVELSGQHGQGNSQSLAHVPSLTVPFHRGARIEAKKAPSPQPPISHGYRTPRSDYGWRHAGER